MEQANIKKLIKQSIKDANNAQFTPSQRAFEAAARTFVHQAPSSAHATLACTRRQRLLRRTTTKPALTVGKFKRHKERLARGVKPGFGRGYSAPDVVFRVEFAWCDEQGEEDGWQIHWIHCRKFEKKEYRFLKNYFNKFKKHWNRGENLESELVLRYIAHWLILNKEKEHLNLAFVYSSPKVGNETIRDPIYEVRWNSFLKDYKLHKDFQIIIAKCIWHEKPKSIKND